MKQSGIELQNALLPANAPFRSLKLLKLVDYFSNIAQ
jgi:hypothetical protein